MEVKTIGELGAAIVEPYCSKQLSSGLEYRAAMHVLIVTLLLVKRDVRQRNQL